MQLKTRNAFKKQIYRGAPLAEPRQSHFAALMA
jgi:hypothetical protein